MRIPLLFLLIFFSFAIHAQKRTDSDSIAQKQANTPPILHINTDAKIYKLNQLWWFITKDEFKMAYLELNQIPQELGNLSVIQLPSQWHQNGFDYDGVAWYRMDFKVSRHLMKKDLAIVVPYLIAASECYVNGKRIGRSGIIDKMGHLVKGNTQPQAYIIPAEILKKNAEHTNTIAIRARSYNYIGGMAARGLYMGTSEVILAKHRNHEAWTVLLSGIFLFVAFSYSFTFFGRSREISYLFFSMLAFSATCITIGLGGQIFFISSSIKLHLLILHYGLNSINIMMLLFFHKYFQFKLHLIGKILICISAMSLLYFLTTMLVPTNFKYYAYYVLPYLLKMIIVSFIYCIFLVAKAVQKKHFGSIIILTGFAIYGLAAINDVLSFNQILDTVRLHDEGLLVFILSMAVTVSLNFSHTHQKLKETHELLEKTQLRYRELIEKTTDIVFSLKPDGTIIMINKAIHTNLGIGIKQVLNKSIFDLLYHKEDQQSLDLINDFIMRKNITEVLEHKKRTKFHSVFQTILHEPRELEVELEFMETADGPIISGRAHSKMEDEMIRMMISQSQEYNLLNYISIAESFTQRVGTSLARYVAEDQVLMIKMALREIIINSIEHGNLNISFNDKTKAQAQNSYYELLHQRQKDPRFSNRRVYVRYMLNAKRVRFFIRDDGDGFDHKTMLNSHPAKEDGEQLMHGRGLIFASSTFDKIQYNAKGNAVYLLKTFPDLNETKAPSLD